MPAANTDKIIKAAVDFVTAVGGGGVADAVVTTVPLVSSTGLPTDTAVELTINRVDSNGTATPSKKEVIRGVVSGSNIINCVRGVEGTAQAHSAGAVVECMLVADQWNRQADAYLTEHNQDGTHLATSVSGPSHAATSKSTPVDADEIPLIDSAASWVLKKLTWSNVKATLKTYFDTLYQGLTTDGWTSAGETPTYSSVDTATGVITVASGAKNKYPLGARIKFTQSQSLTSYWSFDTNSNDGVGANNGTDTSMSYTAGKFSNAATFNGTTSKIVLVDASSLKPTGEFTIGMWVKTSVTASVKGLFQSYSANTNVAGIDLYIDSDNALDWVIGNNTGTTIWNSWSRVHGKTNVCDNNWHHIVVTWRNNYGQMYIDGKLDAAGYMLAPGYAATNYPRIGARNTTGTDGTLMSGQIDDLFLINGYALDEDTIRTKYDSVTAQGSGTISVVKMGIVHDRTDTSLTLFTGTDFTLVNSAITNFYYSMNKVPLGFIATQDKWGLKFLDGADRSVAVSSNTWTQFNSVYKLDVPIGSFEIEFMASGHADRTTAGTGDSAAMCLSTSTSTFSDDELVCMNSYYGSAVANSSDIIGGAAYKKKTIRNLVKTTYYILVHMQNAGTYYIQPSQAYSGYSIIRAISSWL